jgi:hypothetical protein
MLFYKITENIGQLKVFFEKARLFEKNVCFI